MRKAHKASSDLVALPAVHSLPALDPRQLGSMAREAEQSLLRQGESENTLRSYRSALRYWAAWYALRYRHPIALPCSEATVVQFVVDHAQRQDAEGSLVSELPPAVDAALVDGGFKGKLGAMSLNTLVHRVSVLSKAHQMQGVDNPCELPRIRDLLAKTRRAYVKRGALPAKKPALTREPLEALLATCDDSLRGKRDRALLLFAWASGGRRRSEVSAADLRHLARVGPDEFTYELAYSKSNQAGANRAENHKPIAGVAAKALQDWLQASGIRDGALFRKILRGGHLGDRLSAAAVRDIVRARAALAGIQGDYSAHSLRSGFVTEATLQATPLAHTMAMSGHASVQSVLGYTRAAPGANPAARLMDVRPSKEE